MQTGAVPPSSFLAKVRGGYAKGGLGVGRGALLGERGGEERERETDTNGERDRTGTSNRIHEEVNYLGYLAECVFEVFVRLCPWFRYEVLCLLSYIHI